MTLDVIVVSYNTRELLRACLKSLEASTRRPDTVWVVDNASADGSAEMVRADFPEVVLIDAGENLGFAKANNLAFGRSEAQSVLLLNSDAEVSPDTIEIMARRLEGDPTIGAVGPVLVGSDGNVQFEGGRHDPSIIGEFSNITHLNRRYPSGPLGHYMMNDWDHRSSRDVEVLSGACMLLRTEALGGELFVFDYFMYCEDVELSQRVRAAGYRNYYDADASVLHHGGASSKQARTKMRIAGVVSMAQLLSQTRGWLYAAGYVVMVPIAFVIGLFVKRAGRVSG